MQNLNARTAIITTPEKAEVLMNMNSRRSVAFAVIPMERALRLPPPHGSRWCQCWAVTGACCRCGTHTLSTSPAASCHRQLPTRCAVPHTFPTGPLRRTCGRTPLNWLGAEHAGGADQWLPQMAAALGACLAHAVHQAGYAASTQYGLSKTLHQHDDRCQFLRRGFVCDSVAYVASWQQLDGRSLDGCSSIQPIFMHVPPRRLLLDHMAHGCHSNDCQYDVLV